MTLECYVYWSTYEGHADVNDCTWHQLLQWDTVTLFHSPTEVPPLFIFQHSQFNKYRKAESYDHTKIAIHLKIEGF